MTRLGKRLLGVALGTALLLLIPAIAMRFTPQVSWGPVDFLLAAALLFGAGSLAVIGLARVRGAARRIALVLGIAAALLLVWAELAVGLFT